MSKSYHRKRRAALPPSPAFPHRQRVFSGTSMPWHIQLALLGAPVITAAIWYKFRDEAPFTHRRRIIAISKEQERRLGRQAFQEILASNRILNPAHPRSQMVHRVGSRIAQVCEKTSSLKPHEPLDWEFVVIDSPEVNAFVLPGGKVCVYSGMFQILRNEDSLAAVLSHEAAHAVARHVAEKLTLSGLFFSVLLLVAPDAIDFAQLVYKLGIELPFSRKYESEADYIGLRLMAEACYDPRESPKMFAQLAEQQANFPGMKYFSTHPPADERVEDLRKQMDEAMDIFRASNCTYKRLLLKQSGF